MNKLTCKNIDCYMNCFDASIFRGLPNGILVIDREREVVYANPVITRNRIKAFSNEDFVSIYPCLQPKNTDTPCGERERCRCCALLPYLKRLFDARQSSGDFHLSYQDENNGQGGQKWFLINGTLMRHLGKVYGILSFADISSCKHREQNLHEKLKRDMLTNTANKSSFYKYMRNIIADKEPFVICMADLDGFKIINDNYGHVTGDKVLRLFADAAKKSVRSQDMIGRYGGDAFVFLLFDIGLDSAFKIMKRIAKEVKKTICDSLPGLVVSFSAGMAKVEPIAGGLPDCDELIHYVDRLMYRGKQRGKNRLVTTEEEYVFD